MSNAEYLGGNYKYPFQDPSLPWDQRVDDLVGRLTIDEIAKQTAVRVMIVEKKLSLWKRKKKNDCLCEGN